MSISIRSRSRFPLVIGLTLAGFVVAVTGGLLVASYPQASLVFLVAPVAVVGLLIIGQQAEWGLLLSIFLLAVQKSPRLPGVGYLFTLSEAVFMVTALAWLLQNIRQRHGTELINPFARGLLVPFFLYVVVAVLSLLTAFQQSNLSSGFAELFARVYLMVFVVVVASYTNTAQRYYRVLLALVASALLVIIPIPLAERGIEPIPLTVGIKYVGFFRNPNALAAYAMGTILLFLPLAFARRRLEAFPHLRILVRLAIPGLVWALVSADSQGAYVGLLVGLLVWPLVRVSKRLGPILVVCVLVFSAIALASALEFQNPDSVLARGLSLMGYEASRIPRRLALLESHFQTIVDHPFTGVGIGQVKGYTAWQTDSSTAKGSHFTIVGILSETGILGLLAVSIILAAFVKIMWENTKLNLGRASGWPQVNEGLTLAFISMLVFGLTHDVQTNRVMWFILALIVGFSLAATSGAASRASDGPQSKGLSKHKSLDLPATCSVFADRQPRVNQPDSRRW